MWKCDPRRGQLAVLSVQCDATFQEQAMECKELHAHERLILVEHPAKCERLASGVLATVRNLPQMYIA